MSALRIIHVTDLHLSLDEPRPHGVDVWDNWRRVTERSVELDPDLMVIGGDLALHQGDIELYRAVGNSINQLPFYVVLQPGNHDDPSLFHDAFGKRYRRRDGEPLDRTVVVDGHPLILLDTSAGETTGPQLDWLAAQLAMRPPSAAPIDPIVFTHYPPVVGFNTYMDGRFALRNHRDVLEVLENAPAPVSVFCGHYHMEHAVSTANVAVHVTPAVFYQIDPEPDEFHVQSTDPGLRIIDLDRRRDPALTTWVETLSG